MPIGGISSLALLEDRQMELEGTYEEDLLGWCHRGSANACPKRTYMFGTNIGGKSRGGDYLAEVHTNGIFSFLYFIALLSIMLSSILCPCWLMSKLLLQGSLEISLHKYSFHCCLSNFVHIVSDILEHFLSVGAFYIK